MPFLSTFGASSFWSVKYYLVDVPSSSTVGKFFHPTNNSDWATLDNWYLTKTFKYHASSLPDAFSNVVLSGDAFANVDYPWIEPTSIDIRNHTLTLSSSASESPVIGCNIFGVGGHLILHNLIYVGGVVLTNLSNLNQSEVIALKPSTINGFSSSVLSTLTSTQIGFLTTTQIEGLTSTTISEFTTQQIAALTTSQLASLTTNNLPGLTTAQIVALTTSQIPGLQTNQISALLGSQIQAISSEDIAVLSADQIGAIDLYVNSLTTTQIHALNSNELNARSLVFAGQPSDRTVAEFVNFTNLTSTQIQQLHTTFDVAGVNFPAAYVALRQANPAVVGNLSLDQINQLLASFNNYDFGFNISYPYYAYFAGGDPISYTPVNFSNFSLTQIESLLDSRFRLFDPSTITASSLTSVPISTIQGIVDVNPMVRYLSSTQIQALTTTQIQAMTAEGLNSFNLAKLSLSQISAITAGTLSGAALSTLTDQQFHALNSVQLNASLSYPAEYNHLLEWSTTPAGCSLNRLTTSQIALLDASANVDIPSTFAVFRVAAGSNSDITGILPLLSNKQVADALNFGVTHQFMVYNDGQPSVIMEGPPYRGPDERFPINLSIFTTAQVAAFNSPALNPSVNFAYFDIAAYNSDTNIAALTTTALASIETSQSKVQALPITALTTSQFSGLHTAFLSNLSTTQVQALNSNQLAVLTQEQKLALNLGQPDAQTVAQLIPALISIVPAQTIAELPVEIFGELTTSQLQALTTSQIAAITSEELNALDAGRLQILTIAQIATLTPQQCSTIYNPNRFNEFTTTQIAAFNSFTLGVPLVEAALTSAQIQALTPTQLNCVTNYNGTGKFVTEALGANVNNLKAVQVTSIASGNIPGESVCAVQASSLGLNTGVMHDTPLWHFAKAAVNNSTDYESGSFKFLTESQFTSLANDVIDNPNDIYINQGGQYGVPSANYLFLVMNPAQLNLLPTSYIQSILPNDSSNFGQICGATVVTGDPASGGYWTLVGSKLWQNMTRGRFITSLQGDQIAYALKYACTISDKILSWLTADQIASTFNVGAYNFRNTWLARAANFSVTDIQAVLPETLASIKTGAELVVLINQFDNFTAAQIAAIDTQAYNDLFAALTADQVVRLTPAQINKIQPSAFPLLNIDGIIQWNASQVAAINSDQAAAITLTQISAMSAQLGYLTTSAIAALDPSIIPAMAVDSLIFPQQSFAALTPAQIFEMSGTQLNAVFGNFSAEQILSAKLVNVALQVKATRDDATFVDIFTNYLYDKHLADNYSWANGPALSDLGRMLRCTTIRDLTDVQFEQLLAVPEAAKYISAVFATNCNSPGLSQYRKDRLYENTIRALGGIATFNPVINSSNGINGPEEIYLTGLDFNGETSPEQYLGKILGGTGANNGNGFGNWTGYSNNSDFSRIIQNTNDADLLSEYTGSMDTAFDGNPLSPEAAAWYFGGYLNDGHPSAALLSRLNIFVKYSQPNMADYGSLYTLARATIDSNGYWRYVVDTNTVSTEQASVILARMHKELPDGYLYMGGIVYPPNINGQSGVIIDGDVVRYNNTLHQNVYLRSSNDQDYSPGWYFDFDDYAYIGGNNFYTEYIHKLRFWDFVQDPQGEPGQYIFGPTGEVTDIINGYVPGYSYGFSYPQKNDLSTDPITPVITNPLISSAGALADLSAAQIAAFTSTQIFNLGTLGISELSTTQVKALSTTQIAILTPHQISSLRLPQISALTTTQIQALTSQQLPALTTSEMTALQIPEIAAIKTEQIAVLTVPQIKTLSTAQISGLTTQQIPAFTPIQIKAFSSTQIPALTTAQIPALATTQIQSFKSVQIPKFTTLQLPAFTTTQLNAFKNNQIIAFSTTQISAFTTSQVASLNTAQISALTPTQVPALTSEQIGALTPNQIAALTTGQIASLTGNQLSSLDQQQFDSLSPEQQDSLSQDQLDSIPPEDLGNTDWWPGYVQDMTPEEIAALGPSQLEGLTPSDFDSLSPQQLDAFDLRGFGIDDLLALMDNFNGYLKDKIGNLGLLTLDGLASLVADQLARISSDTFDALSPQQQDAINLDNLTPDDLLRLAGNFNTGLKDRIADDKLLDMILDNVEKGNYGMPYTAFGRPLEDLVRFLAPGLLDDLPDNVFDDLISALGGSLLVSNFMDDPKLSDARKDAAAKAFMEQNNPAKPIGDKTISKPSDIPSKANKDDYTGGVYRGMEGKMKRILENSGDAEFLKGFKGTPQYQTNDVQMVQGKGRIVIGPGVRMSPMTAAALFGGITIPIYPSDAVTEVLVDANPSMLKKISEADEAPPTIWGEHGYYPRWPTLGGIFDTQYHSGIGKGIGFDKLESNGYMLDLTLITGEDYDFQHAARYKSSADPNAKVLTVKGGFWGNGNEEPGAFHVKDGGWIAYGNGGVRADVLPNDGYESKVGYVDTRNDDALHFLRYGVQDPTKADIPIFGRSVDISKI